MAPTSHQHSTMSPEQAQTVAAGLGWFSIGLGLVELLAPQRLTEWLGMKGNERLLQLYGGREIANGIGVLTAKSAPWLWGRVGGDALDMTTLLPYLSSDNPRRTNARVAFAAVTVVTSLDIVCANALSSQPSLPPPDYSGRSGFPKGIHAARGAARDFVVPSDMRAPEPMRPWS